MRLRLAVTLTLVCATGSALLTWNYERRKSFEDRQVNATMTHLQQEKIASMERDVASLTKSFQEMCAIASDSQARQAEAELGAEKAKKGEADMLAVLTDLARELEKERARGEAERRRRSKTDEEQDLPGGELAENNYLALFL